MDIARVVLGGERPRTAALLLAALLSLLLGFRLGMTRQNAVGFGLQVPAPGLDLSYTYAMNRASAEGRVFGRDFVSTYGPFGYVIAAMDLPGIVTPWILSQLLLTTALGLAAFAYTRSVGGSPVLIGLGTILLLVVVHVLADEYRWLCVVLLLVLLSVRSRGRVGLALLALGGLLAGFGLLIKLSLGTGALLTVVAAVLVGQPWRGIASRLLGSAAFASAGLGLGLWLHQGSLDGLGDYLTTAQALTGGYSSAMSLTARGGWQVVPVFGVFTACLGAALLAPGKPHPRAVAAVLLAPAFVAWKHGMVRQDGHIKILVVFGLVLLAIALVEIAGASALRRASPWLFIAAVALGRVWFDAPQKGGAPAATFAETLFQPLRWPGLRGLKTLASLQAHRAEHERASAAALRLRRLPETALQLLGSRSVDVYPWEASYAAANDFHWSSRPSPASFATYTPTLDRRNAAFFEAPSRPSFVLWHPDVGARSIDGRHLFWDEPLTLRTLLARYDLAWRGDVFLLQARTRPRFGPAERLFTTTVGWGEWLVLPRVEGVLLAEIEIDTPFRARARRVWLHEEPAVMGVRFTNGDRPRFRYVPDQARSGLWMHPLPRGPDDVTAVLAGTCPQNRAEAVRFLEFRPGARAPRLTFWRLPGAAGPVYECR